MLACLQLWPKQFIGFDIMFESLDKITRSVITTEEAAYYLNRKPQTLRGWACLEHGPLRPIKINGRLAWSVSEIRKLLQLL